MVRPCSSTTSTSSAAGSYIPHGLWTGCPNSIVASSAIDNRTASLCSLRSSITVRRPATAGVDMRVSCPNCGAEQRIPDDASKKKIRCKDCDEIMPLTSEAGQIAPKRAAPKAIPRAKLVSDDDGERPVRARKVSDSEDDNEGAPSRTTMWIAIGGGTALLVLVAIGLAIVLILHAGGDKPVASRDDDRSSNLQGSGSASTSTSGSAVSSSSDKKSQPPKVPWRGAPDPGPDLNIAPKDPQAVVKFNDGKDRGAFRVLFPESSSRLAVVFHGPRNKEAYEVIDLMDFQRISLAAPQVALRDETVSPDGLYVRGREQAKPQNIDILSLATGKKMPDIGRSDPVSNASTRFAFLPGGRALTIFHDTQQDGKPCLLETWDLTTGQVTGPHDLTKEQIEAAAVSPGGAFVAVTVLVKPPDFRTIRVYKINTGELLGELALPEDGKVAVEDRPAFSPDGVELACLCSGPSSATYMLSWSMTTGEPLAQFRYAGSAAPWSPYKKFEWLPDRSGWLFKGKIWIDADSGELIYKLADLSPFPSDILPDQQPPQRLVGRNHRVAFYDERNSER